MGKGKRKTRTVVAGVLASLCIAAIVAVAIVFLFVESAGQKKEAMHRAGCPAAGVPRAEARQASGGKAEGSDVADPEDETGDAGAGDGEKQDEAPPGELQAEDEEKKVEAFDSLTDKWMEKSGGEVTMKDMDDFVASFKSVPAARKGECLHRALNLVSDEHVLLLAGILLDKSIDREYLELVFNDVLNRNEEVKKLILLKIFKDKTHPCWADTAWILDVTGELPKKEKKQ